MKLEKKDMEAFAKNHNIIYTDEELSIVYQFLQDHFEELLNGDEDSFHVLSEKISPILYENLFQLYQKYYNVYLS